MNMVSPAAPVIMGGKIMINSATINKLIEMRLTAMATAFRTQLQDSSMQGFSFEERLGMLVDVEYANRKNNRLHRLIKNASFDQPGACIADINYRSGRKLNKNLIERLSSCEYILFVVLTICILVGSSGISVGQPQAPPAPKSAAAQPAASGDVDLPPVVKLPWKGGTWMQLPRGAPSVCWCRSGVRSFSTWKGNRSGSSRRPSRRSKRF